MTDLPRNNKLLFDFWANMNPGPLTDDERREFQGYFEYFLRSARKGDTARQYDIAIKFLEGFWVEADQKQAAYWFAQAANNGDVDAQEAFAGLYCLGVGVERNAIKAAQWISLAAERRKSVRAIRFGQDVPSGYRSSKGSRKSRFLVPTGSNQQKSAGTAKKSISERIGPADSLVWS